MKIALMAALGLLIAGSSVGVVQAQPYLAESCMEMEDSTLVTWDCEFEDSAYAEGTVVELTVNWSVDTDGPVQFCGFETRGNMFTPRDKKDPVEGTEPTVLDLVDAATGYVTVEFLFLNLHDKGKSGKKKGNAHFFLLLYLDQDGDGVLDENPTKFGVNLHASDPPEEDAGAGAPGVLRMSDDGAETVSWGSLKARYNN